MIDSPDQGKVDLSLFPRDWERMKPWQVVKERSRSDIIVFRDTWYPAKYRCKSVFKPLTDEILALVFFGYMSIYAFK